MAETAISIGANTFQFFTRNPRGGAAKPLDPDDIAKFLSYSKENGINTILAHAPYTLNAASKDPKIREFAHMTMRDDIARLEETPGNLYNFHPGSHVKQGMEKGIELISDMINTVFRPHHRTTLLLETMTGKGTEVCGKFEEIREIIDRVSPEIRDKTGVCFDTCHVNDAGYDLVNDLDGVLTEFDKTVGLHRIKAIHLNDSMNPLGSKKDRHQKIGQGFLGLEAITRIINHPALKDLPFFLETPNEIDGYAEEIKLLRSLRKD
jgi:deoxyribonuclease-4